MTEEIREIIDSAKARGLYEQMLEQLRSTSRYPKKNGVNAATSSTASSTTYWKE